MQKASFKRKVAGIDELKDRKCDEKNTNYFVVDKVIELTRLKYEEFAKNLLTDFDFIEDNTDFMYIDTECVLHTILIKEEGKHDGILVESEGYNYARYAAYYEEDGFVTDKIKEQILTIRQEGKYNMFDTIGVQGEAFEKEFNELVVFLWEFKKEYVQFIMTGQR